MKKKISLFILCGVILLGLCGCGNKETTFQLSYEKISDDLIITSGSTGYKIILPTNTKFFEKPDVLKGIFKFYDYSNGERIEDISYSTNIDVSKAGIYTIDIEGKYNEKIGTTQLEVELVESCSGTCTINTTNWNIELDGTFTYGDYSPNYILKVKSTFSPNASAFEFNTKTEQYEPINDGFINALANEIPKQIQNIFQSIDDGQFMEGKKKEVLGKLSSATPNIINQIVAKAQQEYLHPITQSVATLPIEELALLAESMINITSLRRKVAIDNNIGTVGGPIDVGMITKGDGFIWIKRKHYFDQSYNPQYFYSHYMREGSVRNEHHE